MTHPRDDKIDDQSEPENNPPEWVDWGTDVEVRGIDPDVVQHKHLGG